MKKMALFFIGFFLCSALSLHAQDHILPGVLPLATDVQVRVFDSVRTHQMDVAANGLNGNATRIDGEYIGWCKAKNRVGGPWPPLADYKKTVCGKLKWQTPGIDRDDEGNNDRDLGGYIDPDVPFDYIVSRSNRPAGHQGYESYQSENGNAATVHYEYAFLDTHHQSADTRAETFLSGGGEFFAVDDIVGAYGAWVSDPIYEDSPEIHPAQQMWKKITVSNTIEQYTLIFIKDKSGRYESISDYDDNGDCDTPGERRIWLHEPLESSFYIAFRINLTGNKSYQYILNEEYSSSLESIGTTNRKLRQLVFQNRVLLTVFQPSLENYDISFVNVRRLPGNGIMGYIKITTSIGGGHNYQASGSCFLRMLKIEKEGFQSYVQTYKMDIRSIQRLNQEGAYAGRNFQGKFMLTEGDRTLSKDISLNEGATTNFPPPVSTTSLLNSIVLNKVYETEKLVNAYIYSQELGLKTVLITLEDDIDGFLSAGDTDFDGELVTKNLVIRASSDEGEYFSRYNNNNPVLLRFRITFTLTKYTPPVVSTRPPI